MCDASEAVELLGDRYSLPLLRELLYGYHRFGELATLTGAPRTLLTGRLRRLEEAGVVERRRYCERPPRDEYHLTQAGAELAPVLLALKEWGERHTGDGHPTTVFAHTCGAEMHPLTVCAACREPVLTGDLTVVGGTHPPVLRG